MKKIILSALMFILPLIMMEGCATATATPTPTSTPLIAPTRAITTTATSAPTLTQTPTSISTVPIDFQRVALNDFFPNLIVSMPLSMEIPKEYVIFAPKDTTPPYYWGTPEDMEYVRANQNTNILPLLPDHAFFTALFSTNVGYDQKTDQFINTINDMSDTVTLQEYKAAGMKINDVEKRYIGEYPILIIEADVTYPDSATNTKLTRKINFVYVASLVETNVVLLYFDFSLTKDDPIAYTTWEHFKNSFERMQGTESIPLVPFITATP